MYLIIQVRQQQYKFSHQNNSILSYFLFCFFLSIKALQSIFLNKIKHHIQFYSIN